jgi:cytochrome c5
VSKQDSQFFNVFSLVLGILVAITLVLFALARSVGAGTQSEHVLEDAKYHAAVRENIRPFARVAVAGEDNTALAIAATSADSGAGGAMAVAFTDGQSVYEAACTACHGAGIGGAPKTGDAAVWAPRIAQGKATLYKHAIEGFQGSAGVMPAKGGRTDISDELIQAAVDYMAGL